MCLHVHTIFTLTFTLPNAHNIKVYLEEMSLWGANTLVIISEAAKFATFDDLLPLLDRNAKIGARAQVRGFFSSHTLVCASHTLACASHTHVCPILLIASQASGFKVGWIFNNEGFASHPSNISYTRPAGDSGDFSPLQELVCPAKGLDYLLDTVWGPILQRIRSNGLSLDHLVAWP